MNLSELIYQVVKNAILYENNAEFTKLAIRKYSYALTTDTLNESGISIDSDYKKNVDNAFLVVNQAIQRIASLDKLSPKVIDIDIDEIIKVMYIYEENGVKKTNIVTKKYFDTHEIECSAHTVFEDNIIDLSSYDVGRVLNVFYKLCSYKDKNLDFNTRAGNTKLHIIQKIPPFAKQIHIEYYPEVKFFDYEDIQYHYSNIAEEVVDNDIDLKELGLSNVTCSFILLWCKGTLGRDIYGSEADTWVNQAEQYFLDLPFYNNEVLHENKEVEDIYLG